MAIQFQVVYLSPNGSTRKVAESLAAGLSEVGLSTSLTDLADPEASAELLRSLRNRETTCLLIGSPVYFNRAAPPVIAFIQKLPETAENWAVPFVTYGKACSGVALWQMATALEEKGYKTAGAAKVLAVHSMMWESDHPEGEGHPSKEDLAQVRKLAETVGHRFLSGTPNPLTTEDLDYLPEAVTREVRSAMGQPWPILPKTVDGDVCTECGSCVDVCPVDAITLNPFPEFGENCIDCFNCVRLCPEEAITPRTPLAKIEASVRDRVKTICEQPPTQLFFGAD